VSANNLLQKPTKIGYFRFSRRELLYFAFSHLITSRCRSQKINGNLDSSLERRRYEWSFGLHIAGAEVWLMFPKVAPSFPS
jgi:hypothetical protein